MDKLKIKFMTDEEVMLYLIKVNEKKRHVEDRILEHVGINDIEASAYLAGYLSQYMY